MGGVKLVTVTGERGRWSSIYNCEVSVFDDNGTASSWN